MVSSTLMLSYGFLGVGFGDGLGGVVGFDCATGFGLTTGIVVGFGVGFAAVGFGFAAFA